MKTRIQITNEAGTVHYVVRAKGKVHASYFADVSESIVYGSPAKARAAWSRSTLAGIITGMYGFGAQVQFVSATGARA